MVNLVDRESQDDLGEGQTVLQDSFCGGQEFHENKAHPISKEMELEEKCTQAGTHQRREKGITKNLEGGLSEGVQGPPV